MASSLALSSLSFVSPKSASFRSDSTSHHFCGFRCQDRALFKSLNGSSRIRYEKRSAAKSFIVSAVTSCSNNGAATATVGGGNFDYDLVIIGAGVGGHGAALHAVEKGLKVAIVEGDVIGGTCVNRGCVPSKALLAVSGRMREFQNEHHLKSMGLQVASPGYDRQGVADHANNLASDIRGKLTNSMKAKGVDILIGTGSIIGPHKAKYGDKTVTARDIIIATGSVPFVPNGIEVDGKTVFTSDQALKLEWIPEWIAIVGSGYIGLEFSDVYTALGSEEGVHALVCGDGRASEPVWVAGQESERS